MNAVSTTHTIDTSELRRERQAVVPVSETSALLQVIERAARDPNVDIVKMKELFAMRKEIAMEIAEAAFNAAMNACQAEMRPIAADANNPQTRSKYASHAQLDSKLRPIYTRHGFSISYDEGDTPKVDHIRVLGYLSHSGGFTRTYRTDMPADGKGAKGGDVMTKTHAAGSAKSYGKRYILKDAFNVAVGEDDTDGNDDDYPRITERQAADLKALITEYGGDISKLLRYFKVGSLAEIHAKNFDWAVGEVKRLAKIAAEARSK